MFVTESLAAGDAPAGWTTFESWEKAYAALANERDPVHGAVVPTLEDAGRLLVDGFGWDPVYVGQRIRYAVTGRWCDVGVSR